MFDGNYLRSDGSDGCRMVMGVRDQLAGELREQLPLVDDGHVGDSDGEDCGDNLAVDSGSSETWKRIKCYYYDGKRW